MDDEVFIRTENIPKLVTKEDNYHIHKILGIICIVNFIYQYVYTIIYGKTDMDNEYGQYIIIAHGLLSISSLIFHIPLTRNKKSPMIYPEFRLHSIIFAIRSISCYYLSYYDMHIIYKMLCCYLTMISADIATYFTSNSTTTMRNMPFSENISEETQNSIIRFHSSMQVSATLYMLGNEHSAFFTLYPIQLAAFLMTLVRKNIITSTMWHRMYSFLLISNILCFNTFISSYVLYQLLSHRLFKLLRFTYSINKYISWTFIFILYFALDFLLDFDIISDNLSNYNIDRFLNIVIIFYFLNDTLKYIDF